MRAVAIEADLLKRAIFLQILCALTALTLHLPQCHAEPAAAQSALAPVTTFEEPFADLKRWQHVGFPKIKRHTKFSIVTGEDVLAIAAPNAASALKLDTNSSASVLILRSKLILSLDSVLKWSWMVSKPLPKIDVSTKVGDDYAIRIYVMASSSSEALSTWDRIKLLAAAKFGDEKPGPTLAYVRTAAPLPRRCMASPYTSLVRIIPFVADAGLWSEAQVSPAKDFRECFGVELKGAARLAIMADSDSSGSSSLAYIADLKLKRQE